MLLIHIWIYYKLQLTKQILIRVFSLVWSLCALCSFQTHDSKEHLAMMERVLGPIPTHMLQKTR